MTKKVLLGVTGSIAAYKSAELVRKLKLDGYDVRVVMTQAATEFVSTMTFQALSSNPVRTQLLDVEHEAAMGHIELARWPDQILVAPASADFIARIAHGFANDLLSTLILASDKPIAIAPAMNQLMWRNQATTDNIRLLSLRGIKILGPASGNQACGDVGLGRMLETDQLYDALKQSFDKRWLGKKIVITAGPTREAIDPVRYIGNRSSGKMGYGIATVLANQGAKVVLVSGPVSQSCPENVVKVPVESAEEMYHAVMNEVGDADVFVASAAVADYRIKEASAHKIKKTADQLELVLQKNKDILSEVAKQTNVFTLGFAAETENLEAYARKKLQQKKLDMIAANIVGVEGQGFDADDNSLLVIWDNGKKQFLKQNKLQLAAQLVDLLEEKYHEKRQA